MHASMQVTEAAKGQMAFYRPNNSGYGVEWQAAATVNSNKDDPAEVPQYRELVSFVSIIINMRKEQKRI